jgi:hypothetical protein
MTLTRRLARLLDNTRMLLSPEPAAAPARVPVCRCAGRCRCAGVAPSLLLRRIERECEFYRSVM